MSIMTQLEFALDFSTSEKSLAKYILENGNLVLDLSIKELASNTYTSPATIVRLCKKLGLQGYFEFKIKYSAELQFDQSTKDKIDVNYPFNAQDTTASIIHNIASLHKETIDDTVKLIDYQEIDRIAQILLKARNIFILGHGNSIVSAQSFQHRMMRIGRPVIINTVAGEQHYMAEMITKEDAAIVISYSGETTEVVSYAKLLKDKNIACIGITSVGDNQLNHVVSHVIHTCSREKIFLKIAPFSSNISIEYILDILFSVIFQQNHHYNLNRKIMYDKKVDDRHAKLSPINND